ncbi:hypothetical protein AB0C40_06875 [Streptomyces brevispora]|uniref:hypothetical protein n=1 Tax=Streptomyces brevispora TaxID=887462 RepID=UPI0033F61F07
MQAQKRRPGVRRALAGRYLQGRGGAEVMPPPVGDPLRRELVHVPIENGALTGRQLPQRPEYFTGLDAELRVGAGATGGHPRCA